MSADVQSRLHETIMVFARFLRQAGCEIGTGEILSAVEAASIVGVQQRDDFKEALRSTLIINHKLIPLFDQLFDIYWRNPDKLENVSDILRKLYESRLAQAELESMKRDDRQLRVSEVDSFRSREENGEESAADEQTTYDLFMYSREEILRAKHFESYSKEELNEAKELLKRYRWSFGEKRLRRLTPGHRRYRLHMRGTIRRNIFPTQDFARLAWRQRKKKPRPLVVLLDVSGSMENYTRILIQFVYTLAGINRRLEAFTFGTRLTRITHYLRQKDADTAAELVSRAVEDWSGGTRIGEAVEEFNLLWARRVLGGGAVVLIISDGWDTGDLDTLRNEMDRLHRSVHRLIWLNPNLGYEGYEPLTQGIQTIAPHVDQFLPVHNLQSLIDLGHVLADLIRPRSLTPFQVASRAEA
ncbi:MAG: VWA domain-containing protein [Candidatus Marinimicrobia bacterium]|nr:VWA domain-containing protein [Candidatus Neomarinimicrobiota bacterium]